MNPFVKTRQRHCQELIGGAELRVFRIGISPHPLSPSFSPPTYPSPIPIPHYPPPSIFFLTHASQWSKYDERERKSVDLVEVKYVLQLSKEKPRTDKKSTI